MDNGKPRERGRVDDDTSRKDGLQCQYLGGA